MFAQLSTAAESCSSQFIAATVRRSVVKCDAEACMLRLEAA